MEILENDEARVLLNLIIWFTWREINYCIMHNQGFCIFISEFSGFCQNVSKSFQFHMKTWLHRVISMFDRLYYEI